MKDDIKEIQKRIDALKEPKDKNKTPKYQKSSFGFRVVVELLSGVVVGAGIGYFFDDFLSTKPWFLIVFLFFGAMAGILNVYRLAIKEGKNRG